MAKISIAVDAQCSECQGTLKATASLDGETLSISVEACAQCLAKRGELEYEQGHADGLAEARA